MTETRLALRPESHITTGVPESFLLHRQTAHDIIHYKDTYQAQLRAAWHTSLLIDTTAHTYQAVLGIVTAFGLRTPLTTYSYALLSKDVRLSVYKASCSNPSPYLDLSSIWTR